MRHNSLNVRSRTPSPPSHKVLLPVPNLKPKLLPVRFQSTTKQVGADPVLKRRIVEENDRVLSKRGKVAGNESVESEESNAVTWAESESQVALFFLLHGQKSKWLKVAGKARGKKLASVFGLELNVVDDKNVPLTKTRTR